jgi:hypothetical protein
MVARACRSGSGRLTGPIGVRVPRLKAATQFLYHLRSAWHMEPRGHGFRTPGRAALSLSCRATFLEFQGDESSPAMLLRLPWFLPTCGIGDPCQPFHTVVP